MTGSAYFKPTAFLNGQCSSIVVRFGSQGGTVIRNENGTITMTSLVGNTTHTLSNPEQVLEVQGIFSETTRIEVNW